MFAMVPFNFNLNSKSNDNANEKLIAKKWNLKNHKRNINAKRNEKLAKQANERNKDIGKQKQIIHN